MNDRLAELQADVPDWARDDGGGDDNGDIEMGSSSNGAKKESKKSAKQDFSWAAEEESGAADQGNGASSQPEHMKQFFNDVEAIKGDISSVSSATEQIVSLKDKAVLATSEQEETQISDTIRTLVESTNKRAKTCKNLLGLLKQENSNLSEKKQITATDLRVRENLVNTLLRKFVDEMKRYPDHQA
jgi:hypothetical protein